MTKEVEEIIRNKDFIELTNEEREQLGELAQNEEEFANMKWFLVGADAAFDAERIEPSPELRQGVMDHLTASRKKKGIWLNSVGAFLLPEGKAFYQKPAFQMGMAAAVVIGLLFFVNPGMDENSLAVNDTVSEVNETAENTLPVTIGEKRDQDQQREDSSYLENFNAEQVEKPEQKLELTLADEIVSERMNKGEGEAGEFGYFSDEEVVDESFDEGPVEAPVMDPVWEIAEEDREEEKVVVASEITKESNASGAYNSDLSVDNQQEKSIVQTSSNRRADFKRDRNKNKFRAEDKKEKMTEAPSDDAEKPGYTEVYTLDDTNSEEDQRGKDFDGKLAEASEQIQPKSFHIKQTKELNFLFYVAK